jgi:hypothetical protein
MNPNLEFLVPLAFVGFIFLLGVSYAPGNILYFISGRLWLWQRKAQREANLYAREARNLQKELSKYRKAFVPEPEVVNILQKKGAFAGYFIRSQVPIKQNRSERRQNQPQKVQHYATVWTEDEKYPPNAQFFVENEGVKEAKIPILENQSKQAHKFATKDRRRADFRAYVLAPLVDCAFCMLFWYSAPLYALMNLLAGYSWANYPTHLLTAYLILAIAKKYTEK